MRKAVCWVHVQSKPPSQETSVHLMVFPSLSTGVSSASFQGERQPFGAERIHFTFLSRPILMMADWWREEMMMESSLGS